MEWITSDTHFGHKNIIKYCDRPFTNVEGMDWSIIRRWNECVQPDDTVYHLGDFAMGNKEYITKIRKQLNGKIILILGNHDNHSCKWYLDCGFDEVIKGTYQYDEKWLFSHYPQDMSYSNVNGIPQVWNMYGHVHTHPDYKTCEPGRVCVCCDRSDFYPCNLQELISDFKFRMELWSPGFIKNYFLAGVKIDDQLTNEE